MRQAIGTIVPPGGRLLTGAPRTVGQGDTFQRQEQPVWAVDGGGDMVATFDKFDLVPLGEYVPMRGDRAAGEDAAGHRRFRAGPGPRTLDLAGPAARSVP